MYNHCYTFDKSKFGYFSGSFSVDHVLSKDEEIAWNQEMDRKVINTYNSNPANNYQLSDIDTSYVYLIREF